MKRIIIIPALEEKTGLASLIKSIPSDFKADIVVLDGGQNGWEPGVCERVQCLLAPLGNGLAVRAGLTYGLEQGYDQFFRIDGDSQHDPTYLKEFANKLERNNADFIIGSRYHPEVKMNPPAPPDRILLNVMMREVIKQITNITLHDVISGFWGLKRKTVEFLLPQLKTEKYGLTIEIILRLWREGNFNIQEIPHQARYAGTPKLNKLYTLDHASYLRRSQRIEEYISVIIETAIDLKINNIWETLIKKEEVKS